MCRATGVLTAATAWCVVVDGGLLCVGCYGDWGQSLTARPSASAGDSTSAYVSGNPFEGPITPAQALRFHVKDLTEYEQGEILEFKQVYCLVRTHRCCLDRRSSVAQYLHKLGCCCCSGVTVACGYSLDFSGASLCEIGSAFRKRPVTATPVCCVLDRPTPRSGHVL